MGIEKKNVDNDMGVKLEMMETMGGLFIKCLEVGIVLN